MDRSAFISQTAKAILAYPVMNILPHIGKVRSTAEAVSGTRSALTLFLAGDVMTGRGIDQVLPHSVNPRIYERYAKSARRYVQLAEEANGSIPDEISYRYLWGDALSILEEVNPVARVVNLETSVTSSDAYWKRKGIHYRMHPANTALLKEAGIDVCVVGNNHILDWGYEGLDETLESLRDSGLQAVGAGENLKEASDPAVLETGSGRLLVFSYASPTAGVPLDWSAEQGRPGVKVIPRLTEEYAEKVASHIHSHKKPGDRVLLSLHWGSNWGYEIPSEQQSFARRIIDREAADLIHGHSSHHPRGMEVYKNRLIMYGCGDLINDYEGIGGHEQYRSDLRLMYFPKLGSDGSLESLRMFPLRMRRFQLERATEEASAWLGDILDRECGRFGHSVKLTGDGRLVLEW